jgi:RNA polymerase sigma-70 factor (ECF subfamily)
MSESDSFGDFMRRIRSGDAEAARELVQRYEPAIRLAVRARLTDPALKRQFDPDDVCQSVMRSFFVRASAGQYDLTEPGHLEALLMRMAQNKLAGRARFHLRERRDARQVAGLDGAVDVPSSDPDPVRVLVGRELLAALRSRLTPEEQALAERRGAGMSWAEIAAELGGTPDGRRMQLTRAINRIAPELGLDAEHDDA